MSDQDAGEPRPVGRPSLYSAELAAQICERIVNGESLRSICRDESMPCASTVCLWRTQHREFSEHYALAQQTRSELGFDDIQEIADNGSNDWMESNDPDNPGYKVNGEHIQRSRLRVDTMKWRLARMNPKYSDRTVLAGDPSAPLEVRSADDLTDAQLAAIAAGGRATPPEPTSGED